MKNDNINTLEGEALHNTQLHAIKDSDNTLEGESHYPPHISYGSQRIWDDDDEIGSWDDLDKENVLSLEVNTHNATYNFSENMKIFLNMLGISKKYSSINLSSRQSPVRIDAIISILKNNSVITYLNLSSNNLEGMAIARALKLNCTLTTLDISSNNIGDKGARAIAEALEINCTLTTLDISSNNIGDVGVVAIAHTLELNSTLDSLALSNNKFGYNTCRAIVRALKINRTISTIGFDNIELRCSILRALNLNRTLKAFNLNKLNTGVVRTIVNALRTNNVITHLNLSCHKWHHKGWSMIANILKYDSVLTTINLSSNEINAKGGVAIAEALKVNCTLQSLNLCNNSLGSEGIAAIAKALEVNSTLQSLDLSENEHTFSENIYSVGMTIANALKINRTLTTLNIERPSHHAGEMLHFIALALKDNYVITSIILQWEEEDYPFEYYQSHHHSSSNYYSDESDDSANEYEFTGEMELHRIVIDLSEREMKIPRFARMFKLPSVNAINIALVRNKKLFWSPKMHRNFSINFHQNIMCILLSVNRSSIQTPEDIWMHYIFPHFIR